MKRFDPARLIEALRQENLIPVPKGWLTVDQIRTDLNLAYTRNASSRAHDLHRRGVLDRQPHQFKANTGQCHKAYIYRPKPPFKSVKAAADGLAAIQSEKVPKGYVRIVEYARSVKVSDVAVRCRIARAGLKPKFFKTARGISGVHRNAFYRKTDLDRICG
jgi:hypothetical protein